MSDSITEKIVLSPEQLKQIARYELTFKELISKPVFEDIDVVCPQSYLYTLEDLTEAVKNLMKADPTVGEFGDFWFYPITEIEEAFDLDRARGYLDDEDDIPEELKAYAYLPVSASRIFDDIWWILDDTWSDCDDDMHLSEVLNFDSMLQDLDRYASNKGKPILEWEFSENEKLNVIRFYEDDERVKNASEDELILVRKFIDYFCSQDNNLALHIKGYACYGGNRLYECDWPASRDCMLRLFEKTDGPQYANTLGYIFYYGRCNGGVPEYEKAFHYFEIAAANGLYEGMYKLADMFTHGYGCKKSLRTARSLYGMVYEDSYRNFVKGSHANFADAALRMGNVYAKGINERIDNDLAYSYYLQADYAAKIRAENSDFFGNTTVVMNTQKALEETRSKLPEDYFQAHLDCGAPVYLMEMARDNNRCTLTRKTNEDGSIELTAERLATKACPSPEQILITTGSLNLCQRTGKSTMTAINVSDIWFSGDSETVRFDFCDYNNEEDRYDFYYDDELTARIKCKTFRIYAPEAKPKEGHVYRLASIKFSANGRIYDYICDFEDVKPGDTVIVNGYDGETEVTVVSISQKYESELTIPIERFKKILRKVK